MKLNSLHALAALAILFAGGGITRAQSQTPGPADYEEFSRFIASRNIFDPNREPHAPRVRVSHIKRPHNTPAPAFSFVGAMVYNKGMFAFFDGNNADYRKALQVSGTIAGYTIRQITLGGVRLVGGGKTNFLAIGSQLQQQSDGTWSITAASDSYSDTGESSAPAGAADSSAAAAVSPAPTGEMSDVLKRLMMHRQQENK